MNSIPQPSFPSLILSPRHLSTLFITNPPTHESSSTKVKPPSCSPTNLSCVPHSLQSSLFLSIYLSPLPHEDTAGHLSLFLHLSLSFQLFSHSLSPPSKEPITASSPSRRQPDHRRAPITAPSSVAAAVDAQLELIDPKLCQRHLKAHLISSKIRPPTPTPNTSPRRRPALAAALRRRICSTRHRHLPRLEPSPPPSPSTYSRPFTSCPSSVQAPLVEIHAAV